MYCFRDSYVNQQIEFGVARSVDDYRHRSSYLLRKTRHASVQVLLSMVVLASMFGAVFGLLELLGIDLLGTFLGGRRITTILVALDSLLERL